ncbi:MAG: fused MFS/spermidine synthase [Planctomycetia bacterium]|nr:fused MFS/spermidine synthase [Planctomycetia bacterium]
MYPQARRRWLAALILPLLALGFVLSPSCQAEPGPIVEREEKSKYSKIRILKEGSVRTLGFVQDSGEMIVESRVDLERPHELQLAYTRHMFTSYLFRPQQERVLIVGLGGGAMVHFLKHYEPKVKVDVVEIDPAIVKIADQYFGVRAGGNVAIHTADAFDYLKKTEQRYDVIYLDAFLKPSADTDGNGIPLHLKTVQFYKDIQKKLTADGLVVYNVHPHDKVQADLKNISDAFPQCYVFRMPQLNGFVAVGSLAPKRLEVKSLKAAAEELNQRWQTSYSFRDMVDRLAP